MTNEEINEAIAKHTGWKQCDCGNKDCLAWFRKESWEPEFAPLFATDLNAMHEAEKMLTSEQVTSYVYSLESMNERWSTPAFATASQRAEAFLRTIGKWKEAKP